MIWGFSGIRKRHVKEKDEFGITDTENSEIEYHIRFMDLLATTCISNEECQKICRSMIGLDTLVLNLSSPLTSARIKSAYWNFLRVSAHPHFSITPSIACLCIALFVPSDGLNVYFPSSLILVLHFVIVCV
jgi:hypothetical protein